MGGEALVFRIDEEENALDSLERAAEFLERRAELATWFKWTVLGLHHALYGFLICAIKGTDPDRVTDKRGRLISLWEALKRAQDHSWTHPGKTLVLSQDEKKAIEKIADSFRNEFQHFVPKGWSIFTRGSGDIFKHVARVIEFIVFESGNLNWFSGAEEDYVGHCDRQQERVRAAIARIRAEADSIAASAATESPAR